MSVLVLRTALICRYISILTWVSIQRWAKVRSLRQKSTNLAVSQHGSCLTRCLLHLPMVTSVCESQSLLCICAPLPQVRQLLRSACLWRPWRSPPHLVTVRAHCVKSTMHPSIKLTTLDSQHTEHYVARKTVYGLMSYSTHYWSFQTWSSQPLTWLVPVHTRSTSAGETPERDIVLFCYPSCINTPDGGVPRGQSP